MGVRYQVVETSSVTDEELTKLLNEWTSLGWTFEGMQFAMRDGSRRPSMAFLTFTRPESGSGSDGDAGDAGDPEATSGR